MSPSSPAAIIKHSVGSTDFDEPDHAIPSIHVVDVWGAKIAGGGDLSIVIASPLGNDAHSRKRFRAKVQAYLAFLRSDFFEAEAGAATPSNTSIVVQIHSGSDPGALEFIRSHAAMVESGGARLEVRTLTQEQ